MYKNISTFSITTREVNSQILWHLLRQKQRVEIQSKLSSAWRNITALLNYSTKQREKRSKIWMSDWMHALKPKSQLLLQRAWQKPSHLPCPVVVCLSITALPYLMWLPLICEYCVPSDTLEAPAADQRASRVLFLYSLTLEQSSGITVWKVCTLISHTLKPKEEISQASL